MSCSGTCSHSNRAAVKWQGSLWWQSFCSASHEVVGRDLSIVLLSYKVNTITALVLLNLAWVSGKSISLRSSQPQRAERLQYAGAVATFRQ